MWAREGFLTATPGVVIRYDHVAADLVDDQQRFDLVQVAYDRFLIKHFETAVERAGRRRCRSSSTGRAWHSGKGARRTATRRTSTSRRRCGCRARSPRSRS